MEMLFSVLTCGLLYRCVRNVLLKLIGILGLSCLSLAVDFIDVLDSLLDVEGVSDSSSDDLGLERVGLLLLLVFGVVAGEVEGEVEVVLVESAAGGKMRGLLLADR